MWIGLKKLRNICKSRRWPSIVLLFCFSLANICPLVPVTPQKDASERFPCENHACGCRSAEHCWRKCCCFSREQKLAWAKANHVAPPAEFLAMTDASNSGPTQPVAKKCCCSHRQVEKTCCSKATQACCSRQSNPSKALDKNAEKSELVLTSEYLGCQGIAFAWMTILVTTPDPLENLVTRDLSPAETLLLENERLHSHLAPPDVPPPRSA